MPWTKRQLVEGAFAEIGLRVDTFNVRPAQLEDALQIMDSMLAQWDGEGIQLGYNAASSPDGSNLDDESGLPARAYTAVRTNLAIQIAPSKGKTLSQATVITAKNAYDALAARASYPPQQQLPSTLPRGAGNKPIRTRTPFFPEPTDPLVTADGANQIDFE